MIQPRKLLARSSGVLLHPTALPGNSFCGTFGEPSRRWLKKLAQNDIGVWQLLPLSPTDSTGSPYSSPSSFAINPWFLDVTDLIEEGFLQEKTWKILQQKEKLKTETSQLNFKFADHQSKIIGKLLREEWSSQSKERHSNFDNWCSKNKWIENHSIFTEIHRQQNGIPWWEWPEPLALHNEKELNIWQKSNQESLLEHRLLQWHLDQQWQSIRKFSKELGVLLFGDLPFYVSRDSSDVWGNRSLFSISADGKMDTQSGVPPDYFSETGQLWGTPVYEWELHKENKFNWWRKRFARQWHQFDLIRLDHFRALESYWAIDGEEKTAQNGEWLPSPGKELLDFLKKDCKGGLPLIAEDLGIITKEVENLRDQYCLPGMKILQFAFDGNPKNPYLPENIKGEQWVVYTGTHDNPTTLGWWAKLDNECKERVSRTIQRNVISPNWELIELGLASTACLVVVPVQDLLGLGNEARFNMPGTIKGNWSWRMATFDKQLEDALKVYGDRGSTFGRSKEGACKLLGSIGNL